MRESGLRRMRLTRLDHDRAPVCMVTVAVASWLQGGVFGLRLPAWVAANGTLAHVVMGPKS